MTVSDAQAVITKAVSACEGVTVQPYRFSGVEYVIARREIGHIHGDQLVDIPFPKKIRDQVVLAGAGAGAPHLAGIGLGQFLSVPARGRAAGDRLARGKLPNCMPTKIKLFLLQWKITILETKQCTEK